MLIRPACKNPQHPGSDRDTMACAREATEDFPYYVFWCRRCAEVLKVKAVQVTGARRYQQEVRRALRLPQTRPAVKKRITYDGSLQNP